MLVKNKVIVQIRIKSKNCCNTSLHVILIAMATIHVGRVKSTFYNVFGCTVVGLLLEAENRERENRVFLCCDEVKNFKSFSLTCVLYS
jgi:hypothetical protein